MARIYTADMEAVLGPISQSIGDLLSFVDASEQDDIPLKDLTAAGDSILSSSQHMAKIGLGMATGKDPVVDRDMPAAASHLSSSGQKVHDACQRLKADPKCKAAKRLLEEGVRGILEGTQQILEIGDDAEVRELVNILNKSLDNLKLLKSVKDTADLVSRLKPAVESLVKVARQTERRSKQLGAGQYKDEVVSANAIVIKSTPMLVSALRTYIVHNTDPMAATVRDSALEIIEVAVSRISYLVQLKFYRDSDGPGLGAGESALCATDIFKALDKVSLGYLPEKDKQKELMDKMDTYFNEANRIAGLCKDKANKSVLQQTIDRTISIKKQMKEIEKSLLEEPENKELTAQYQKTAAALTEEIAVIQKLAKMELMRQKEEHIYLVKNETACLITSAGAGNVDKVKESGTTLLRHSSILANTAELVASHTPESTQADKVRTATKKVKKSAPMLIAAATIAGNNPKDPIARGHANVMYKEYQTDLDKLSEAVDLATGEPGIAMSVNEAVLSTAVEGLVPLAECQDNDNFDALIKEVEYRFSRAAELAEVEAENTRDSTIKPQILARSNAVRKASPLVLSHAKKYFKNPKSEQIRTDLTTAQDNCMSEVSEARKLIGGVDIIEEEKKYMKILDQKKSEDVVEQEKMEEKIKIREQKIMEEKAVEARKEKEEQERIEHERQIIEQKIIEERAIEIKKEKEEQEKKERIQKEKETIEQKIIEERAVEARKEREAAEEVARLEVKAQKEKDIQEKIQIEKQVVEQKIIEEKAVKARKEREEQERIQKEKEVIEQERLQKEKEVMEQKIIEERVLKAIKEKEKQERIQKEKKVMEQKIIKEREAAEEVARWEANAIVQKEKDKKEEENRMQNENEIDQESQGVQMTSAMVRKGLRVKKIEFVKSSAIGAAAQELHAEANQWDDTQNDIVASAKAIAENFNHMAALAGQPNSKRELISLSKNIAIDAKITVSQAHVYANNCADIRLKQQLLTVISRIETISAQLKIIATVKATHYMNSEADEQLTICAQNLMEAVGASVTMCHSASLRPLTDKVCESKWRRKVYQNGILVKD